MTRTQKRAWMAEATDEQVLNQLLSAKAILCYCSSSIGEQVEAQKDLEIAREEILRRMAR